ncbi:glycerophosphoryl diester phosphodiesterase [Paenibacillus sp. UNCCL117]|uniref:glycerophosphodiester phosphodiesterase family protein n=1 Tax=unclassified Paenibacillus TaxID=185978 RepID=UPI0008829FA2|nr:MULTISPECIES: glycerophosphodiester phosphodiesterase family protein [unclassified Paenibacillus]SDC95516.1 glycerophosphoryl diester phosphodiesterase [Paenibacillus sp. cl123]SFW30068.1 glycerophosphoryl diester phosphodiesterase [Paenibacillus sp. UNCCL117]
MNRFKKMARSKLFLLFAALLVFIFVNNSSLLRKQRHDDPLLLAHRGLGQTFAVEGIENDTCTAERIYEPEHPYLENTIPSMEAAFEAGADIVEIDVHITKDNQFAIFHDWTLDCRTNVEGVTRDYTMAELRKVDIGYGYTADGGATYPFRGKGVGMMPSLTEILGHFPDKQLLIDVKSNDLEEGKRLAEYLSKLPKKQQDLLAVYGGDVPVAALKEEMPEMRVMSKATMKACLLPYLAVGWTGYGPQACKQTQLHIPEEMAKWLWGWPDTFLNRMDRAGTRVIVVGGDGSSFSSGFDTPKDIERLPSNYSGGIWTNRIDRIAPLYK